MMLYEQATNPNIAMTKTSTPSHSPPTPANVAFVLLLLVSAWTRMTVVAMIIPNRNMLTNSDNMFCL